jgi:hypothetical protein
LDIRWKTSLSATCLHAAACRRAGIDAADVQLAAVLDNSGDALIAEITEAKWPVDDVLAQLATLSADFENNRELVSRALARLHFNTHEALISGVAGRIADLESALRRMQPDVAEELAVRGGPIREQWEARGPGMLRELGRLTDDAVVPEAAEIVLVSPYAGGHGCAHAAQNRVTLEAVLVNPHPHLPETLRIAWLLGQLNSDLPKFADALPGPRRTRAFELAMLAPTLAAGEAVELVACDESAVDAALDAWRLRGGLSADAGRQLWQWWNAWLDHPQRWPVAVAALGQMMA